MGQIGSAMSNPNTFAPDPSGFNKSEWTARFLGAGAKGLGQGMQNQLQANQGSRGGGTSPIPQAQPATIMWPSFGKNNNFYGGS